MVLDLFIREIVRITIRNHNTECLFRHDIEEVCIEKAKGAKTETEYINAIIEAFKECELYCPHENIDKRQPGDKYYQEINTMTDEQVKNKKYKEWERAQAKKMMEIYETEMKRVRTKHYLGCWFYYALMETL